MGQRTLAFTRLLLRKVFGNTLRNHGLLIVYTKRSCIQHIWIMKRNSTPNMYNQVNKNSKEKYKHKRGKSMF
jgi:hypothetical protein